MRNSDLDPFVDPSLADAAPTRATNLDSVVAAWNDHAGDQAAIHPSGAISEENYRLTGEAAAEKLVSTLLDVDVDLDAIRWIVDYGAGDGRVSIPMARRFPGKLIAVDSSQKMLAALARRAYEADVALSTLNLDGITPIPIPRIIGHRSALEAIGTGDVDVVYSLAVLIHHRHADAVRLVSYMTDMIRRRGGLLLLDLPLYEVAREPSNWTDVGVWTLEQLLDVADALELDVLRANVSPGPFHPGAPGRHHGDLVVLAAAE